MPNTNVPIDKVSSLASTQTEQLNVSNRVLGLERSPLNINNSNQVNNGDDLAQQIAWAKHSGASQVKIALSPEHLGALEISIEDDKRWLEYSIYDSKYIS